MPRVAVVEDEELIRTMIQFNLEQQGFVVEAFGEAESFLARATPDRYDAVLLDIMLPGLSGRQVVGRLRAAGIETPVLMVTAVGESGSVVGSLEQGADDYLTKPFHMDELLARVRAAIRRSQGARVLPSHQILRVGRFEINLSAREADSNLGRVSLSAREIDLLAFFARNPRRSLSRGEILDEVWGLAADPTPRTVDNFILRFRKLFEADPEAPRHFLTVRATGYLFEP